MNFNTSSITSLYFLLFWFLRRHVYSSTEMSGWKPELRLVFLLYKRHTSLGNLKSEVQTIHSSPLNAFSCSSMNAEADGAGHNSHLGAILRSQFTCWHVFGKCEENGEPWRNQHRRKKNMQNHTLIVRQTQDPEAVRWKFYLLHHWVNTHSVTNSDSYTL